MEYEDFSIRIEPAENQRFRALITSPAGQGRSTFQSPFTSEHPIPLLIGLAGPINSIGDTRDLKSLSVAEQELPETVGRKLFDALLTGPTRSLFERSLGLVYGPPRRGLRIRLHLEPDWPELRVLCTLPWEFICTENGEFLNLDRLTPVVRYLDVDRPAVPAPLSRTLHVLVISSNAPYGRPLDLKEERNRIQLAFQNRKGVSATVIGATREALEKELLAKPPHIIHFMGHGKYGKETGEGALLFETADGLSETLSGSRLATLLQLPQPPVLVVLNACNTAALAGEIGLNPFTGVATALVKKGIMAVIAMQFPITDEAAVVFSGTLYERLAVGDPVDAAVAEARLAVHSEYPGRAEWGTPVLFLRTPNGRLFDLSLVSLEEKAEAKRFLRRLSEAELRVVLERADPYQNLEDPKNGMTLLQKVEALLDTAGRRGEDDWRALLESILCVHSLATPFSPLEEALRGWVAQPEGCWQLDNGEIIGLGDDPQRFNEPAGLVRCSMLSWQGLRFRDGCTASRIWIPLLECGSAIGLVLRFTSRGGLIGIIHCSSSGAALELWQAGGTRLSLLGSAPITVVISGWYELSLTLKERRASFAACGIIVEGLLQSDLQSGFAGLVKFGNAFACFSRLGMSVLESKG